MMSTSLEGCSVQKREKSMRFAQAYADRAFSVCGDMCNRISIPGSWEQSVLMQVSNKYLADV